MIIFVAIGARTDYGLGKPKYAEEIVEIGELSGADPKKHHWILIHLFPRNLRHPHPNPLIKTKNSKAWPAVLPQARKPSRHSYNPCAAITVGSIA